MTFHPNMTIVYIEFVFLFTGKQKSGSNNLGYVRLNGSYNILKSINFQVAGIPSLCKEKNMNMKSMSYTGKVL